jgi:hypothetical protein
MVLAGIEVVDTPLVHDAMELARNSAEPYLFNHAMRSWLFSVLIAEGAKAAPDPELLAVSALLHDLGLTDRYSAQERFEVEDIRMVRSCRLRRGFDGVRTVSDEKRQPSVRRVSLNCGRISWPLAL